MNRIKNFILKYKITIGACVLMAAFGFGYWILGSPDTTTIGENVSVGGNLTVGGASSLANLKIGATEVITSARALQNVTAAAGIITSGRFGLAQMPDGAASGQVFTAQGAGVNPVWAAPSASGDFTVTPINWNVIRICQAGTCCPPWGDCDGDGKTYAAANDCNEGCNTCYVGSTATTWSQDSLDQNCNGQLTDVVSRERKYCAGNFEYIAKTALTTACTSLCTAGGGTFASIWCYHDNASPGESYRTFDFNTCGFGSLTSGVVTSCWYGDYSSGVKCYCYAFQ